MREEDSNWFAKWEEELPSPEELMPLSQSLITPDLALFFDIRNHHYQSTPPLPPPQLPQSTVLSSQPNSSTEFDSAELGGGGGDGGVLGSDEPARSLKRPRLVWTPQLHKRFVDAVAHLGIKNAVPKTIMQLMCVDGLTRENVASHLQKYRLYLRRMQGMSSNGSAVGNNGPAALTALGVDPASDRLFASSPVPAHFLNPSRPNSDHFTPFVPVASMYHHHHHHPMPAVGPGLHHHPQQFRHFGTSPSNGQFEHPFIRQSHPVRSSNGSVIAPHLEDLESATPTNGMNVLTLFPTGNG